MLRSVHAYFSQEHHQLIFFFDPSHSIATVGKAMSSREEVSYPILRKHDVDYVLIIFGGLIGFSGDDINKFLWMVRIAEGVWPEEVQEQKFFTSRGEYKVDDDASPTMRESLMYKMVSVLFEGLMNWLKYTLTDLCSS